MIRMISTYEAIIKKSCPFCGKCSELTVNIDDYIDYQNGMLVQEAFPELSPSDREFLMTGMCKKCQTEIFSS